MAHASFALSTSIGRQGTTMKHVRVLNVKSKNKVMHYNYLMTIEKKITKYNHQLFTVLVNDKN